MEIKTGSLIEVQDAFGDRLRRRALSGVEPGDTFPVVWACREEEWEAAQAEGREPEATPWPAEDVEVLEEVPA
jgi:hypothetical protein